MQVSVLREDAPSGMHASDGATKEEPGGMGIPASNPWFCVDLKWLKVASLVFTTKLAFSSSTRHIMHLPFRLEVDIEHLAGKVRSSLVKRTDSKTDVAFL